MRRAILMFVGAIGLYACDAGGPYDMYSGGYYYSCRQYTSCEQCTPVYGCGWCSYGPGQGACRDEPNDCITAQFSWTWEPAGCAALGVLPADAGTDVSDAAAEPGDAGPADAQTEEAGADAATE